MAFNLQSTLERGPEEQEPRIHPSAYVHPAAQLADDVEVGACAMVGALSRLSKDVPPFSTTCGGDEVKVYGLNKVGLRRRGLSRQELDALNDAYRIYQDPQLNFSQALEKLQALPQKTAQVAALLGFLTSSQRGVYR